MDFVSFHPATARVGVRRLLAAGAINRPRRFRKAYWTYVDTLWRLN